MSCDASWEEYAMVLLAGEEKRWYAWIEKDKEIGWPPSYEWIGKGCYCHSGVESSI